ASGVFVRRGLGRLAARGASARGGFVLAGLVGRVGGRDGTSQEARQGVLAAVILLIALLIARGAAGALAATGPFRLSLRFGDGLDGGLVAVVGFRRSGDAFGLVPFVLVAAALAATLPPLAAAFAAAALGGDTFAFA